MNFILKFLLRPFYYVSCIINAVLDFIYTGNYLDKVIPRTRKNSYQTESTNYFLLKRIFKNIEIKPQDVLLDVGCGHGRVITWWLQQGLKNKIYGIELNKSVADEAAKRFENYNNVKILAGDVLEKFPEDATLIYLFNPFDNGATFDFVELLNHLAKKNVTVVYNNCLYLDHFVNNSNWRIIDRDNNLNMLLHGIIGAKYAIIQNLQNKF